jgi:dipeptidyl aminopeptidase/acylaminoacyl peptidase
MSVTAPPRRPNANDADAAAALEALIEEARRRTRRRRMLYTVSLLAASAGAAGFFGLDSGGGAGGRPQLASQPGGSAGILHAAVAASPVVNGPLTVLDSAGDISDVTPGNGLRELFRCTAARGCDEVQSLAWSPSGRLLAFSAVTGPAGANTYDGLHVLDARTGRDWHILGGIATSVADLAWSRDGSRLAYVINSTRDDVPAGPREIDILRADGKGRVRRINAGRGVPSSPTWSPDGQRIAFALQRRGLNAVYAVDLAGGNVKLLAQHAAAPAWSPDGTTIAVRGCGGVRLVRVERPEGAWSCSPFGRLLVRKDGPPTWSPDGRDLAIQVGGDGIYVATASGRHLHRVSEPSGGWVWFGVERPAWRPLPASRG